MATTNKSELQETILKAIDAVVTQRNNELKLDKTISAIIKKNIGKRGKNTIYQVEYNGGIFEAETTNEDDMYAPHTGVYVLVPEGNFSKNKVIIGRTTTTSTDRSTSVVAAAVNKYSIVGPNLLESVNSSTNIKDIEYGLHSFHPKDKDTEHGVDHRAQFLYWAKNDDDTVDNKIKFNENRFNLYKQDTTAIMVKADFLTNLDTIQKEQPGARYGLIFNFAFDNLNKNYGETNGEIFENISDLISANVYWKDPTKENDEAKVTKIKLKTVYENFFLHYLKLDPENIANWVSEGGILDQTKNYIKGMYDTFKSNNETDKQIYNNSVQAFLNLLNELKACTNIEDIRTKYQEWATKKVSDSKQKNIQFVLSSDDMLGNPFNFNTWNSQYAVFEIDLDTYNHLESILFYKEGFVEDAYYESIWPIGTNGQPDIFVKNLQIYAMNPMDNQSGDYTLKIEPYANSDIIISDHVETGYSDTTQLKATLLRKFYEDLTANGKTSYVWFKEDSSVTGTSSIGYNYLGGAGWRKIDNNIQYNYLFKTTTKENRAYKNNYKCVAIYEPSANDKTILSFPFSVYNQDMSLDLKLESNLGTNFSFDAGAPTVTVLINEDKNNDKSTYRELEYPSLKEGELPPYEYNWAIQDSANNYVLFLNEIFNKNPSTTDEEIISPGKEALLKNIEKYYIKKEESSDKIEIIDAGDNPKIATRIKYPVSIFSSGFVVTCYLRKLAENNQYYDVGSASLEFRNKSDIIDSSPRIQIINGDQVFQYDEYGKAPNSEKTKKDPLEIQPLQAKLLLPQGIEISGSNYQVEWILPIEHTMINTTETLVINPATDLVQSYKSPELKFNISELYDPDAYANQITCHIVYNGEHYYKDTNFYFGKQGNNGTNGTDTIAKIEYQGSDPINILHYQPLTLYVQKENKNNVISGKGMLNVGNKKLQDEIILVNDGDNNNPGVLKLSVYQKEQLLDPSSYQVGFPKWNLAGNTKEATNTMGKFFNVSNGAKRITWKYNFNNDKTYRLQNIKATVNLKEQRNKRDQSYYAFFSLPIIEYEPIPKDSTDETRSSVDNLLDINRISIDRDKYLNEIVYNADGRNPIYNHNQGLRLYNIPSSITYIEWSVAGGENETKPWISLLENRNDGAKFLKDSFSKEIENNEAMTYVIPDDIFDGSATNNKIIAKLYTKQNGELIATVYAPINITLNTFGLASLNEWDGNSVVINEDDERSYVMAPQIGAGEKDENNRFTGILMGKTETYTGGAENEKEIGLFGYHEGLQSIFLDANTGNATFGLPDVDVENNNYKHSNISNTNSDDYNEGRIELRPGNVSKIGGWRLGRRSLYYITDNTTKELKEIDEPYKDKWAIKGEHQKDIGEEDRGILLNAAPLPYISIKGKPLTVGNNSTDFDIDDSSGNAALASGDSLELVLDPNQKDFFTMFRHYKNDENNWTRSPLVGIDAMGRFYTNALKDKETSLNMNYVPGFGYRSVDKKYVGLFIGYGSSTIIKNFISVNSDDSDTLHISGGKLDDEYARPMSLHGENIGLYAKNSSKIYIDVGEGKGDYNLVNGKYEKVKTNEGRYRSGYISTTTDANIQISTKEAQVNLGNTQLLLKRSDSNSLKTVGLFNVDIGEISNRKNLTINANNIVLNRKGTPSGQSEKVYSLLTLGGTTATFGVNLDKSKNNSNNTWNLNKGSLISLSSTGMSIWETKEAIALCNRKSILTEENPEYNVDNDSELILGNEAVTLGMPDKSLITLNNSTNTWNTTGSVEINTEQTTSRIVLNVNQDPSGTGKTGDASLKNTINTQILLQAGNNTRLGLTSSNNHWTGSSGYPFYLAMNKSGTIRVLTYHPESDKIVNTLMLDNINLQTSKGISIAGNLSEYRSQDKTIVTDPDYGLVVTYGIKTKKQANLISFASTNFSGNGKNPTYSNNSYSVNGITTLKDAIDNCLKAAGLAQKAAADAETNAKNYAKSYTDALKSSLGSAAYANTDAFRSSSWTPTADDVGAVSVNTYSNHTHGVTYIKTAETSDGKTVLLHWSSDQQRTSTPS